jgi:hypothetical protein
VADGDDCSDNDKVEDDNEVIDNDGVSTFDWGELCSDDGDNVRWSLDDDGCDCDCEADNFDDDNFDDDSFGDDSVNNDGDSNDDEWCRANDGNIGPGTVRALDVDAFVNKAGVCAVRSLLLCVSSGTINELSVMEAFFLSVKEDNDDDMSCADASSSDLPDDSSYPCSLLNDDGGKSLGLNREILRSSTFSRMGPKCEWSLWLSCVDSEDDERVRRWRAWFAVQGGFDFSSVESPWQTVAIDTDVLSNNSDVCGFVLVAIISPAV